MEIAGQTRFDIAQRQVKNRDATILLGYSIFASVLLIAIYFGSMWAGIAPGDLASMTVFRRANDLRATFERRARYGVCGALRDEVDSSQAPWRLHWLIKPIQAA